jgi:hypothetical protein
MREDDAAREHDEETTVDEPAPEQERRGVPRTTTTGDPATDVRQPGDGAITDLDADAGEDPSLPDELRRRRRRAPPTGRTPPDDEPDD